MKTQEWIVIALILGFMALITITANFSQVKAKNLLSQNAVPKQLMITLKGAVRTPGPYECRPGISLKELLKDVRLKTSADKRKIPFKKILFSDQTIEIPEKKIKD